MQNSSDRLNVNQKMCGKTVLVVDPEGNWIGQVLNVKDAETFIVKGEDFTREVSIFDVRAP